MIKRIVKICVALLVVFFLTIGGAVLYVNVYKAEIEADISKLLTEKLGKPVQVKNVGAYFGLKIMGLRLESASFDESYVGNILIEINPLASVVNADLVVSHVGVQEAKIKITREMLAQESTAEGSPESPESETSDAGLLLDFQAIIDPVNRVSELFRQISVANVTVEAPMFDAPIKLEKLTLSKPNNGRLLTADLKHLDSALHLEIDILTSPAKIDIRRLELVSKNLVLTPDFQMWLPEEQRKFSLPVEEFQIVASGTAVGQLAKLDLSRLKFKSSFIDIDVKGQAEFNSKSNELLYKVEGNVQDISLAVLDYIPREIVNEKTTSMLQSGIKGLRVGQGYLQTSGGMSGLDSLLLKLSVEIDSYQFDPEWPPVNGLKGDIALTLASLDVALHQLEFQNLVLKQSTIGIADFAKPGLVTRIKFANDIVGIFNALSATPLKPKLEELEKKIKVRSGTVDLDLEIAIDLAAQAISPKLTGQAGLTGLDVDVKAPPIMIRNFGGKLNFQPDLVESDSLNLTVNGEPAVLKFSHDDRKRPGQTDVHLDANISGKMLETLFGQSLDPFLAGRSEYILNAKVLHSKKGPEFKAQLKSNLVGTAVRLKGIFVKEPAKQSSLLVDVNALGETTDAKLILGDLVARVKVESGKTPKFGARIGVQDSGAPEIGRLTVDLPAVAGDVTFDEQFKGIHARFKKMHIVTGEEGVPPEAVSKKPISDPSPDTAPSTVEATPAADTKTQPGNPLDPRSLPTIDLVIDNLRVGHRRFELVEVLTTRAEDGLNIRKLNVEAGHLSQYNTRGTWLFNNGAPKIHVESFIYFRDAGEALKNLGVYQNLSGIKGSVPLQLDIVGPVAEGTKNLDLLVAFDLHSGRVHNLNNVFLDVLKLITFKEVLSFKKDEGLLIRQARGKIRLTDGKMTFIQTGVELDSVAMKLNGPIDFKANTLDLKVATKLRISRTLSTAAIASVSPVAAASMIATDTSFEFDFIDGLGEHTYTMNGSLSDPKLAEVDFDLLGKTGIKSGLKKLNLLNDSDEKNESAPAGNHP